MKFIRNVAVLLVVCILCSMFSVSFEKDGFIIDIPKAFAASSNDTQGYLSSDYLPVATPDSVGWVSSKSDQSETSSVSNNELRMSISAGNYNIYTKGTGTNDTTVKKYIKCSLKIEGTSTGLIVVTDGAREARIELNAATGYIGYVNSSNVLTQVKNNCSFSNYNLYEVSLDSNNGMSLTIDGNNIINVPYTSLHQTSGNSYTFGGQSSPNNIVIKNVQTITYTTKVNSSVVNSAYLTSASARPQVLSNGWIVTAVYSGTSPNGTIRVFVSKDRGATWSEAFYLDNGTNGVHAGFGITSNGTKVSILCWNNISPCYMVCTTVDMTTVTYKNLLGSNSNQIDIQTGYSDGCYITTDSTGILHAVWSSKNSNYPNNFNLRYGKSTDGGVTWTVTQLTSWKNYYDNTNPCIIIRNGLPIVIHQMSNNGQIYAWRYNGSSWEGYYKICEGGSYTQYSPSATVTSDGTIHVVWHGTDSTDTSEPNIRYSKSSDGGVTWSTPIKLTSGNTYTQAYPSIASDSSNNLHVYFMGRTASSTVIYQLRRIIYSASAWSSVTTLTNATGFQSNPALCDNYRSFSEPLLVYQDNQANAVKYMGSINTPFAIQVEPISTTSASVYLPVKGVVTNINSQNTVSLKYQIDNGEAKSFNTVVSSGTAIQFSYNVDIHTLERGTYTLNIWAEDNYGAVSQKQSIDFTKTDAVSLSSPSTSVSSVSLNISDSDPLNTQYQITCNSQYVTEDGTLTKIPTWIRRENTQATSSSITVTGLQEKTKYSFGIKAKHADDLEGVTFNSVECFTESSPPATPTNITTKLYSDKIILSWNTVNNATEYEVEADGQLTTASALSFTHSGLAPNTKHSYSVRAKAGSTVGEWSQYVTVFTKGALPEVPKSIISESQGTSIKISWTSVANATSYELNVDGNIINTGIKTTYTYAGLKPNTQHTVKVRAIGIEGAGEWSTYYTVNTTDGLIAAAPQNITTKATNKTVTLSWDEVNDAEGYDVLPIMVDGTTGASIDNGSLTTCDFRGLIPNTTYKFMVRAKNSAGQGPWSTEVQVTTFLLDTPQNVITVESDESIKFSWDTVQDADTYELMYYPVNQVSSEMGSAISVGTSNTLHVHGETTANLIGLSPFTEYKFCIRAKNSQGNSAWSEEKSTFTLPKKPSTPENVNASVTDTKIIINWTGVQDASVVGYDIELDGVILENDTALTYIHEGLDPYSVHYYRVRARNDLVEGDWSPKNSIRTLPAKPVAPKEITVKSTQTGATLSWKPELGASGYDIYVFTLDEKGQEVKISEVDNLFKPTFTHRRLEKGAEYRYRIRTRNVQGISQWSGDIINNAIKAECKKNNTIDLGLTATDVVDFNSYEMVVTYNIGVVEVVDLSTITGKADLGTGKIDGTGITVKEFSNGRIVFVVYKAITPGEAWTGVINGIKFKAKETGGTTITYTVYEKE